MKFATGFLVLTILAACSPKKAKPEAASAAAPLALAPARNGSLIGAWKSCQVYPQGEIIGVKSSSIVYTFKDETSVSMEAAYYTDDNCQTRFTQALAEETFKHYETLGQAPAPADVKASVFELAQGIHEEMAYSATVVPAGEVGTIDFLSMVKPSFTSYRIWEDIIQIATVCHDLIEEGCELAGDTPSNRARDLGEAERLTRVP